MPAPRIPPEAVAYDELASTSREFPFSRDCSQITPQLLDKLGFPGPTHTTIGGACVITDGPPLPNSHELWIIPKAPPSPDVQRYFSLAWNGSAVGMPEAYFERFILGGRYYAVQTIGFSMGRPLCNITVDTGSPSALVFQEHLKKAETEHYPTINPVSLPGYEPNRAAARRFVQDHCPHLRKLALTVLEAIDPGGGSLATR